MNRFIKYLSGTCALLLGIMAGIAPFTYFLMALGFLVLPGILLSIYNYRKTKSKFNQFVLAVNTVSLLIFLGFIIHRNYADYKASKTYYDYYLPKSFMGWVIIKTGQQTAKPIPVNNCIYKIIIPQNGGLVTSDKLDEWHRTRYFWYDDKDTLPFTPHQGDIEKDNYATLIHCEGVSNQIFHHFYVSDTARNPQDTFIISKCNSLLKELADRYGF